MIKLPSKMMTHHSVMTSSLHIKKNFKLTNLKTFRVISIIVVRNTYLEMLSLFQLLSVSPGTQRVPPADTKCSSAEQQASKRILIYQCLY